MHTINVTVQGLNINAIIDHDASVFLIEWNKIGNGSYEPYTFKVFNKYIYSNTL
ncbi:MAG TPA: hypothetical protein VM888_13780 [Chitinophagaceae bacterium]|nr:hypothetical protein [Chitinophagaceae bacterium]